MLIVLTLLGFIVAGGLMIRAANLGGKINHPEIRTDTKNDWGSFVFVINNREVFNVQTKT